jgi:hypothetical protein
MTYGSEIWISEFKINFNVIDKLLFEKISLPLLLNITPRYLYSVHDSS